MSIYRTIILPVVLYGCETWSLTLREERRLRVFENRVLWKVFGPKRDEVTGKWRKLHNEELNDIFLFISHTKNVLLFKFRCNIFIGVRIIKEMPGSVASGTPCICTVLPAHCHYHTVCCQGCQSVLTSWLSHWRDVAHKVWNVPSRNYLLPFPEFHWGTSKTAEGDRPCYCHSNRGEKKVTRNGQKHT